MAENVRIENQAVPLAWPTRGGIDAYPWDLDPSQRFTRLRNGYDPFWQNHFNTSAPGGWLGAGTAVYAFLPLIEQISYIRALLRGEIRPGPWTMGGIAVERTGGIPWQTSITPVAMLGKKSG